MFNGIYSNATAIDIASRQHDVIANNLANANTPGFRRTLLAISARGENTLQQDGSIKTDLGGSEALRSYVDFTPASIRDTGRPLDVAISGEGFFKVEGDGGPDTDNKVSSINICTAFPWEHATTAYLNIRGTKIN